MRRPGPASDAYPADYAAIISNNRLINISDTDRYTNPQTGAKQGPLEKLNFTLGAYNKYTIDQWQIIGDERETAANPTTEQTIFTTQVPVGFDREAQYELGTVFKATVDGTVTKVRIYTNELEAGEHTVRIWRVADASVVAGPYAWNFSAGTTGWKEFALPSALKITAQTDYIVAVSNSADNRYYAYDTEGMRNGITNGKNLIAYGRGGVSTRTIGSMPTGVYQNISYFRDIVFVAAPPVTTGTGLSATYYDNKDFTGTTVTRTDATVNFDWGTGSPATGLGADEFSVRWQGQVEAPATGTYTFSTTSDDGVRLWVNGNQVINNWTDHAPTTNTSASISLTAGTKYDIRMEYYENRVGAVAKLLWTILIRASRLFPRAGCTLLPVPAAARR